MFRGVGVALATLFREDRTVDLDATAAHARRLVDAGLAAVVVAGSTGEAPALSTDERRELVRAVRDAVGDRAALLAGTGAPSATQAAALTAAAREDGVDGVLALSPPRSSDPRDYYREVVAAAQEVAVLAYHFPAMSPPGVDVDALPELAALGVAGLKDSSGQPERLLRSLVAFDGAVYVGSSALLVQAGAVGCDGAILALANLEPERCIAAFAGDGDAQRRLLDGHLAVAADWPHGLKAAMAEAFGTPAVCRMG